MQIFPWNTLAVKIRKTWVLVTEHARRNCSSLPIPFASAGIGESGRFQQPLLAQECNSVQYRCFTLVRNGSRCAQPLVCSCPSNRGGRKCIIDTFGGFSSFSFPSTLEYGSTRRICHRRERWGKELLRDVLHSSLPLAASIRQQIGVTEGVSDCGMDGDSGNYRMEVVILPLKKKTALIAFSRIFISASCSPCPGVMLRPQWRL